MKSLKILKTAKSANIATDIPWSPKNTWIVIFASGTLLICLIVGTAIYENLLKPNSYNIIGNECIAVRDGNFCSMEKCMNSLN